MMSVVECSTTGGGLAWQEGTLQRARQTATKGMSDRGTRSERRRQLYNFPNQITLDRRENFDGLLPLSTL